MRGGPWNTLGKQGIFGCHPDYTCQFVFTKPYDVEKLEQLWAYKSLIMQKIIDSNGSNTYDKRKCPRA